MIYDFSHETKHTFKMPFYLMHTRNSTKQILLSAGGCFKVILILNGVHLNTHERKKNVNRNGF